MISSKPLKPLKPITQEKIVLGKDYIIKEVQKNTKAIEITRADITIDDIYYCDKSEEVGRWPRSLGTATYYTFYDKKGILTYNEILTYKELLTYNDEEDISTTNEKKYDYELKYHKEIHIKYDEKNKLFQSKKKYYYVFECPFKTEEEILTPVKPDSIQKDKTYLISSCLQKFDVKLNDIQEKTYFQGKDLAELSDEEIEDDDLINENPDQKYTLKLYRFQLTNNSKNKNYVQQDDKDLTLFAYKDEQGNYKWKKYNIYKIFVPQASQIIEHVIGDITSKKGTTIPSGVNDHILSYLRKGGNKRSNKLKRKTRKNKSRKNK